MFLDTSGVEVVRRCVSFCLELVVNVQLRLRMSQGQKCGTACTHDAVGSSRSFATDPCLPGITVVISTRYILWLASAKRFLSSYELRSFFQLLLLLLFLVYVDAYVHRSIPSKPSLVVILNMSLFGAGLS